MTLFRREWAVTVGAIRVMNPIRVAFDIERTTRSRPNTATVRIWNLTRSHQREIEQAATAQVVIEAGHAEHRGAETIFVGELFRARGQRASAIGTDISGLDAVTSIEARDGGRAYQRARISQGFEAGVSVVTVLRALARAMGVGNGNLDQVAGIELDAGGTSYPEGTTLTGQASRELTRILRPLRLTWSVQHGHLQILRRGTALQTTAVRLTPSSGLVGSPEVGTRGKVTATALLTPDLWPGRQVVLDSERVDGTFLCTTVRYRGDSHANEWFAECELEPLQVRAA
jgi:hypothetical protein